MANEPHAGSSGSGLSSPDPDSALTISGLSKAFAGTQALDDVSFEVPRGRIHALLGGNGSGKSTLIKTLAGVEKADAGTFVVNQRSVDAAHVNPAWSRQAGLHFVHQDVGVFPELSVAENFALLAGHAERSLAPIRRSALDAATREALARFDLDVRPEALMGDLSAGMRTMIAVARALRDEDAARSGILILDEPTAALPEHEVDAVLTAVEACAGAGHTVIFVTHRLDEVLRVADSVTFLRDGRHIATGPRADYDYAGLVEGIAGTIPSPATLERKRGPVRLRVSGLAVGPLEGLSFEVRAGEIVGLAGLADSGCSTLLRALFGVEPVLGGEVELDGARVSVGSAADAVSNGIAYVPPDRAHEAAFSEQSIRMNHTAAAIGGYWNGWRVDTRRERDRTRQAIEEYSVVARSTEELFSTLSGGNQQKVILGRWLSLSPRVLLLDQPTQGVDVGARFGLYEVIRRSAAEGMAVVVNSADARELVELSDRILGVAGGSIRGEAVGSEVTVGRCSELAHGFDLMETNPETRSAP